MSYPVTVEDIRKPHTFSVFAIIDYNTLRELLQERDNR